MDGISWMEDWFVWINEEKWDFIDNSVKNRVDINIYKIFKLKH
jgi:hypothetical protein